MEKSFFKSTIEEIQKDIIDVPLAQANKKEILSAHNFLAKHKYNIYNRVDHMFAILLVLQWAIGVVFSLVISPLTWDGGYSKIHLHVFASIILGGALISYPLYLIKTQPGKTITRHVVAFTQMLYSALLIHLTGGRIETHFHVFGSLAFLAFYRDWKVLITASIVIAIEHFIRGVFWPQSVFGVITTSPYRWLEHAAWVIFEDIFLIISINQSIKEMWGIALRQATVEEQAKELTNTINSLQDTQEQLIQVEKLSTMGTLAAGIAHELNNPLMGILNYTQYCKKKIPLESNLHSVLDDSIRELNRCIKIIKNLLIISRKDCSEDIEVSSTDYNEVLERVLSLLKYRTDIEKIEIVRKAINNLPPTTICSDKLEQILMNIIVNSLDALALSKSEKKIIEITSTRTEKYININIIDNGPGIDKKTMKKIFDPFFTTKPSGKGTGLGLSICKNIIQSYGGDITCNSTPNKGTEFKLSVPIVS